jgi:hypothetical protein
MGLDAGAWAILVMKNSIEPRAWIEKIRKDLDEGRLGDFGLALGALERVVTRFRLEIQNLSLILPTYGEAAKALGALREKYLLSQEIRQLHPALKDDDYYSLEKFRNTLQDQIKGHNERTKHFAVPVLPPEPGGPDTTVRKAP